MQLHIHYLQYMNSIYCVWNYRPTARSCLLMVSSERFSSKGVFTMMEDPPPGMGILPVTWASDGKLICNGGLSCAKDSGDGMYMEKRYVFIFICVNCVDIYDGRTDGRMDGWNISYSCGKLPWQGPVRFARFLDRWWTLTSGRNSFSQPLQIYISVHFSIHFFTADGSKPVSYSVHVHQGFVPLGFVWKLGRLHPEIPFQQRRKTYSKRKDLAVFPTGSNPPKHHMVGSCTPSTKKNTWYHMFVGFLSFLPSLRGSSIPQLVVIHRLSH